jgi:hypothetical protein
MQWGYHEISWGSNHFIYEGGLMEPAITGIYCIAHMMKADQLDTIHLTCLTLEHLVQRYMMRAWHNQQKGYKVCNHDCNQVIISVDKFNVGFYHFVFNMTWWNTYQDPPEVFCLWVFGKWEYDDDIILNMRYNGDTLSGLVCYLPILPKLLYFLPRLPRVLFRSPVLTPRIANSHDGNKVCPRYFSIRNEGFRLWWGPNQATEFFFPLLKVYFGATSCENGTPR